MFRTELNDSLKSAMKAKDGCAVSTLRLILAALKDRDIAARAEIEVIERFLPKQLGAQELQGAVAGVIDELEASNIKDMGRVMGALKERYAGRMDFAKASALVKERLV
jgi:uncharacterized protein YqeY